VVEANDAEPANISASDLGQQVMAPFWTEHERAALARLDSVTIDDLCQEAEKSRVRREARDGIDFAI
jgi:Rrf2 family transcriptional regulator, iron-sulfur cluster assembly transcription factor